MPRSEAIALVPANDRGTPEFLAAPEPPAASALAAPALAPKVQRRAARVAALRVADGRAVPREAEVAVEVPVGLVYNGAPHVVMLATPAELEDFALGFSLSEGILASPEELLDLRIEEGEEGIAIDLEIAPARFATLAERRRNMTGRTGCGLCGVDSLTQVARPVRRVPVRRRIAIDAVRKALDALPVRQSLNRATGAVHAAGWADADGTLRLVREDVGRHNALDKLIGTLARQGVDPQSGFALITSRCSFEMVQKSATFGIPLLVAISAPTSLAIEIAEWSRVSLIALARRDSVSVYADPGRLIGLDGGRAP
ncbi:MAG TPA: formate dehydrogenase accessory sulfurtransferase FdhD [Alphaproteobacteria bacterium]|nr:formate dehydrogenase accessory sulfurtransferase FdhD [Alphaproteobacteria bacterium]